jgi:ATP-dependent Clp protease ATP-binding subunit ClpA
MAMFERFDNEARSVITKAQEIARELGHNWIGTEHLLLGLEGTTGAEMLQTLDASDFAAYRTRIVELVGKGPSPLAGAPAFTPRAKKVLELSLREALGRGDRSIRPEHILLGLVRIGEGIAYEVLATAGVTLQRLGVPMSWPQPGRRGRRSRRGMGAFPAFAGPLPRVRMATHHDIIAVLEEGTSLAAKVLAALGVTKEAVEAKADELGPQVQVDVGGQTFDVTAEQAEQIRKWLAGEGPPPAA